MYYTKPSAVNVKSSSINVIMCICYSLHQIIIIWLYFKKGICQVLKVIIAAGGLDSTYPNCRCLNLNEKKPQKNA